MTDNVNASFSENQAKIDGIFPINMYVINASQSGVDYLYYSDVNQDIYGWELDSDGNLTSNATTYTGLPIGQTNIETNLEGQTPSINISVPNVDRVIEQIIQTSNYLRGCDVHVITTFAEDLPSGTGAKYIGTQPNNNACMKETLYVDSTTSTEEAVTFTCKPKFIIQKMRLPNRTFSTTCAWDYNSTECGVSATVVASYPSCDKTLKQCKIRHNEERFGGFVAIPRAGVLIL